MDILNRIISKYGNYKRKKSYINNGISIGENSQIFKETKILLLGKKGIITIGKNTALRCNLVIDRDGGEIHIGDNSYIGENTKVWSSIFVKIGNNVSIAHNCNIFDNDTHPIDYLERRKDIYNIIFKGKRDDYSSLKKNSIIIDDDVWIGCNVIILKGVKIGKGSIIAAGSVVVKDVPPWTMIAGNPSVIKKKLENEIY
jgi:acetyltransferase-like isoleucine patch superfamily enzyme